MPIDWKDLCAPDLKEWRDALLSNANQLTSALEGLKLYVGEQKFEKVKMWKALEQNIKIILEQELAKAKKQLLPKPDDKEKLKNIQTGADIQHIEECLVACTTHIQTAIEQIQEDERKFRTFTKDHLSFSWIRSGAECFLSIALILSIIQVTSAQNAYETQDIMKFVGALISIVHYVFIKELTCYKYWEKNKNWDKFKQNENKPLFSNALEYLVKILSIVVVQWLDEAKLNCLSNGGKVCLGAGGFCYFVCFIIKFKDWKDWKKRRGRGR